MTLQVCFKEQDDIFDVNLEEEQVDIDVSFSEKQVVLHSDVEPYDGQYEIEPTFTPQVLLTSGKRMLNDLSINEIRVSKVSNPFGGNTVCIGG